MCPPLKIPYDSYCTCINMAEGVSRKRKKSLATQTERMKAAIAERHEPVLDMHEDGDSSPSEPEGDDDVDTYAYIEWDYISSCSSDDFESPYDWEYSDDDAFCMFNTRTCTFECTCTCPSCSL